MEGGQLSLGPDGPATPGQKMLPDDLGLSRFLTRHPGSISTKWQGTAGRPRHTAQVMMTFWMLFPGF